ncbi:MAG TPA: NADH:flavin oxidoreductase/NADH oxidase [Pyrinomonadaceae bacterium]|jgi:2,4-dienoyl-CoA reductase-like NADH-dependent reductase (Old Yellow Enzyme family)
MSSRLFEKYKIRGLEFRNRLWVSPMCQYSSTDGMPTDWHLVHLGSRAVGGAGLVIMEATAVSPEGRISPSDAGIWSDAHAQSYKRITKFIREQGAIAGIQIAHAGRKASTAEPWNGGKLVNEGDGGWETVAPSAIAFSDDYPQPREMSKEDIEKATEDFVAAARRAVEAGFEVIEIHAAHGYLFHEFLSPLSNKRADEYGGRLANRMRFPLETARRVRAAVPENLPVFVRISATDWMEGGWDLEQSNEFCRALKEIGIDLIDVSTGGNVPNAKIPVAPGYQVSFAAEIRRQVGIAAGAVGMITEAAQAEEILQTGAADAILIAREFLRDPYFPFTAAKELGENIAYVPKQYGRAIEIREPQSAHRVEKLKAGK